MRQFRYNKVQFNNKSMGSKNKAKGINMFIYDVVNLRYRAEFNPSDVQVDKGEGGGCPLHKVFLDCAVLYKMRYILWMPVTSPKIATILAAILDITEH